MKVKIKHEYDDEPLVIDVKAELKKIKATLVKDKRFQRQLKPFKRRRVDINTLLRRIG